MSNQETSALIACSILITPLAAAPTAEPGLSSTISSEKTPAQRTSLRMLKYRLASTPLCQPMGKYVGELQEQWQFPSDHLPIGITWNDFQIGSWNVLNTKYIDWVIEKNSQGLSRSMIADENIPIANSLLTVRDRHVADLVLQMLSHPTHPRSILALQECGEPLLKELRSRLPSHYTLIVNGENAVLINLKFFELLEAKEVSNIFSFAPQTTLQDLTLRSRKDGQIIRLINVHLPGDPTQPTPAEFARFLANTHNPEKTTIALGDMNFNELEISAAVQQAFLNSQEFSLYSPYCTNIAPYSLRSKAVDHFLIHSPNSSAIQMNSINALIPGFDALQIPPL